MTTNTPSRQPNFILFITDQHRADFLGCYGHPILKTPNLDSIAARGTAFDKFYVASPVCMPNRASLMTGRMPSVHGVRSNGIPLSRDAVTFVDLLRDAGYATALVGKSHLQNFTGNPPITRMPGLRLGHRAPSAAHRQATRIDLSDESYGLEQPLYWKRDDARVVTPFYGYDHVELVTGHGDDVGGDYVRWLRAKDPRALKLLGPANSLPHDYSVPQAYRTQIPAELYSTAYIGERAQAYLQAQNGQTPFFLTISFPDPHHPFTPPGKYWDMYKPADFPVPEAFRRNDWTPPPHVAEAIEARAKGTANLSGMRTIGVSAREAQEARALTCGMIACIDDAIGAVLAALESSGQSEDTIVIFTTDHGDHLGDHKLLLKGAEQYQSIVHVPFIWSDPQARSQVSQTSAIGSTIDIPATILDRARVAPFIGMQGKSLLPAMEQGSQEIRDAAFIQYEHQMPDLPHDRMPRWHTLIDERWRMTVVSGAGQGELYDLSNDPGEFDNLWDSAAHAPIKARLMERLVHLEMDHTDAVPAPTGRA